MSNKFNTDVRDIDPNSIKKAFEFANLYSAKPPIAVPRGEEFAGDESLSLVTVADQLESFVTHCGIMSEGFRVLRHKLLSGMSLEDLRKEAIEAHPAAQELVVALNIFLEAIGAEAHAGRPSQTEEAVEKGTGEDFKTGMAVELAEKFGMPVVKVPPCTQEESEDAMREFLSDTSQREAKADAEKE